MYVAQLNGSGAMCRLRRVLLTKAGHSPCVREELIFIERLCHVKHIA